MRQGSKKESGCKCTAIANHRFAVKGKLEILKISTKRMSGRFCLVDGILPLMDAINLKGFLKDKIQQQKFVYQVLLQL